MNEMLNKRQKQADDEWSETTHHSRKLSLETSLTAEQEN